METQRPWFPGDPARTGDRRPNGAPAAFGATPRLVAVLRAPRCQLPLPSLFCLLCALCVSVVKYLPWRPGDLAGGRVVGRFVEREEGEQVSDLLRLQLLLDPLRHQRHRADRDLLDLV